MMNGYFEGEAPSLEPPELLLEPEATLPPHPVSIARSHRPLRTTVTR